MVSFRPHARMVLCIGAECYRFMPDPVLRDDPDTIFMLEGSEAFIYVMQELGTGRRVAFKVAKALTRGKHIERSVLALADEHEEPGLSLARQRVCLTKASHPRLIATFPELEYAVLMPWVPGRSWAAYFLEPRAKVNYTAHQALHLARMTSLALSSLESRGLSHTDVAGSNILVLPGLRSIELLDMENLYVPGSPPSCLSYGTPGYQHRRLGARGQWRAEGDRFAGAILLTEMLTWWHPEVRGHTPPGADSLFRPEELQESEPPLLPVVRAALQEICPPALKRFEQAWTSSDLSDCPTLDQWAACFQP